MDAADSDTDIMTSAYIYYGMRIHMAELRRFQKWLCVSAARKRHGFRRMRCWLCLFAYVYTYNNFVLK